MSAERSFSFLCIGPRAVGEVVPHLVQQLLQNSFRPGIYLQGFREALRVRSGPVLSYLVPSLIAQRVSSFRAHCMASRWLADVVDGDEIGQHMANLIPWFLNGIVGNNTGDSEAISQSAQLFVRETSDGCCERSSFHSL